MSVVKQGKTGKNVSLLIKNIFEYSSFVLESLPEREQPDEM